MPTPIEFDMLRAEALHLIKTKDAEIARLRAALKEAIGMAYGSSNDLTWEAAQRLRELKCIANGDPEQTAERGAGE